MAHALRLAAVLLGLVLVVPSGWGGQDEHRPPRPESAPPDWPAHCEVRLSYPECWYDSEDPGPDPVEGVDILGQDELRENGTHGP